MERFPRKARKLRANSLLLCATGLIALSSCASRTPSVDVSLSATGRPAAIARSEAIIAREMRKNGIKGLSVAVSSAEGTLWTKGFGKADKAGKPFDASTLSNQGSVSKLFTSTAVMKLVERGLVDLDAPVSRYLPDFKPRTFGPDPDGVTVRALLCHESGLQSDVLADFVPGGTFAAQGDARPYADNVRLASATTLCYEPNSVFSYSNLGYSLLGLVVESVSGKSFSNFVREEVLVPIGMDSSSFAYRAESAERYASGSTGGKWKEIYAIRDMPAGSLCSSADDMGKFLSAVLRSAAGKGEAESGILEPEALLRMWTRQNGEAWRDLDFEVGLGWWRIELDTMPGVTLYYHGGDLDPFHALVIVEPKTGIGVSVTVNSAEGLGSFSLAGIAEGLLRSFAESECGTTYPERGEDPTSVAMSESVASRLEGSWTSMNGLVRVKRSGKAVKAFLFGTWMDVDCRSDGSLRLSARILGLKLPIPVLDQIYLTLDDLSGRDLLAVRAMGILMCSCERIEAAELDPSWTARSGAWTPVSKQADPAFAISKATLGKDMATGIPVMTVVMGGQASSYPVASRNADELYLSGYGRNLGSTVRAYRVDGEERIETFGIEFKRKK